MKACELLGPVGPFATAVPGFNVRPAQQTMADLVAEVTATGGTLVCEAGTGTGKTYAYLVPALAAGRKTLVSTATRTLQDQLFHQDLPQVLAVLGLHPDVALLKGRANYLCLERLARAHGDPHFGRRELGDLARVTAWARATDSGDIGDVGDVAEDSAVWPFVTSTTDNCLGQACAQFDDCFVVRARRAAAAADVVVVNHHLLFADLALREEGFGEILPTAELVIVDEAHQIPDLAAEAFGEAVSTRQLRDLARDTAKALENEAPDTPDLRDAARVLEQAAQLVVAEFGREPGRQDAARIAARPPLAAALERTRAALIALHAALELAAERGVELAACERRAGELTRRLHDYQAQAADDWVRWYDASPRGVVLHATPLAVSDLYQTRVSRHPAAWVYCSATLAVGGELTHFNRELALEPTREAVLDSPFDFARQALLYLPRIAADPGSGAYLDAVIDCARDVIAASRGRAFLLFTSYRALDYCALRLRDTLAFPVLKQGDAPRAALLAEFKRLGNAVLLGTATFWEGVDVRGDALSCVLIDKLPFAPPDDPVTRARARRLEAAGGNPFMEHQVPEAVIMLKQGAGRLIRDRSDRGVLVLCDPRLKSRAYGRIFLQSLPPMPQTRELADVARFFDVHPETD